MQNPTPLEFNIKRSFKPENTFKVNSVIGKFDLTKNYSEQEFVGKIVLPDNWKIGLIVGRSGTGKTTIAKELFPNQHIFSYEYGHKSIIDEIEGSVDDITTAFNSVGFSSPPSWLKPYHVLSHGEKMRVDIARALQEKEKLIVFDEFTSVVDRNIAKICSVAISKAIRRSDKQFIAISCHDDISDWLSADWIFNTDSMKMITPKKKDQTLKSTSSKPIENSYGKFLKTIII